jgi:hypothetical protein
MQPSEPTQQEPMFPNQNVTPPSFNGSRGLNTKKRKLFAGIVLLAIVAGSVGLIAVVNKTKKQDSTQRSTTNKVDVDYYTYKDSLTKIAYPKGWTTSGETIVAGDSIIYFSKSKDTKYPRYSVSLSKNSERAKTNSEMKKRLIDLGGLGGLELKEEKKVKGVEFVIVEAKANSSDKDESTRYVAYGAAMKDRTISFTYESDSTYADISGILEELVADSKY